MDVAVHSLKDLPTTAVDGLVLAGVPQRAPVEDVLLSRSAALTHCLPAPGSAQAVCGDAPKCSTADRIYK